MSSVEWGMAIMLAEIILELGVCLINTFWSGRKVVGELEGLLSVKLLTKRPPSYCSENVGPAASISLMRKSLEVNVCCVGGC